MQFNCFFDSHSSCDHNVIGTHRKECIRFYEYRNVGLILAVGDFQLQIILMEMLLHSKIGKLSKEFKCFLGLLKILTCCIDLTLFPT